MTDIFTTDKRSEIMSRVAHFDTGIEMFLRRALWRQGLRYRVHVKIGRTRPDVVFPRAKVAVFLDGCFWHGCPEHFKPPKSNVEYWAAKIRRNVERDRSNDAELVAAGWKVVRFWSCQIKRDLRQAVHDVQAAVTTEVSHRRV